MQEQISYSPPMYCEVIFIMFFLVKVTQNTTFAVRLQANKNRSGKATIIGAPQETLLAWVYTSCVILFIWNAGKKEQAKVVNFAISKI